MGTKRFLITEDEKRNIINLYNSLIIKSLNTNKKIISESDTNFVDNTKKNIWDFCSTSDYKKIISTDKIKQQEIAKNLYKILNTDDLPARLSPKFNEELNNNIKFCGDLDGVKNQYYNLYNANLWNTINFKFSKNLSIWQQNVNAPLFEIKDKTKDEIKRRKKEENSNLSASGGFNQEKGFYQTKHTQKVIKDDINTQFPTEIPLGTKVFVNFSKNQIMFGNTDLFSKSCETRPIDGKLKIYYKDFARSGRLDNKDFDETIKKTFCNGNKLKTWKELTKINVTLGSGGNDTNTHSPNLNNRSNVIRSRYVDCSGTYKKNCKSLVIKKVQGCLGITDDGKMGNITVNAVNGKIGKTTFTDADVEKLCGASTPAPTPDIDFPYGEDEEIKPYTGQEY